MLVRIFRLIFSSVSWLHSFSSGVSGFVALGLALSCHWFSLAAWPSLGVCLYLRLMASLGVGSIDFLCWALMDRLQRPALSLRARVWEGGKGNSGHPQCQRLPSRVQEFPAGSPRAANVFFVCGSANVFCVCLGEGWPASCSKLSSPSSLGCHPQSSLLLAMLELLREEQQQTLVGAAVKQTLGLSISRNSERK